MRRTFRALSLLCAITLVVGVIETVSGHPPPTFYWAILVGPYVMCGALLAWRGRRDTRASAVNGWEAGGASTG